MKKIRVVILFLLIIALSAFNFYYRPIDGNPLITQEYMDSDAYVNGLYKSDEYFKEKLLDPADYMMYYKAIRVSLEDEKDVTIPCGTDCEAFSDAVYAIILDHPELISFQLITTWRAVGDSIEYSNSSNLNKVFTYFGTRRIEREMENIRKDTKGMSDKDKILYVYDYIASHNYDLGFTWSADNQSAYSFFTKGTSVCAGFAKSAQIIFQNIGIQSYLVIDSDHLWNYVEYEGKYYIFDATVGASFRDKSSHEYYEGLCITTTGERTGFFKEFYPEVESDCLRDIFDV